MVNSLLLLLILAVAKNKFFFFSESFEECKHHVPSLQILQCASLKNILPHACNTFIILKI